MHHSSPAAAAQNFGVLYRSAPFKLAAMDSSSAASSADALAGSVSDLSTLKKDDLRKRAASMGVPFRFKKDDGIGWNYRSTQDVLRDCESKLAASNLPQAAAAPDAPQALPRTGVVGPRRSGPLVAS